MSRATLDSVSTRLSGVEWTTRYPGSSSLNDLRFPFRGYVEAFTAAMRSAKARVTIAATFRPTQRAYLMHWSWRIANMKADAQRIPPMAGVEIRWDHTDTSGRYSSAASIAAAKAMVIGFQMQRLRVSPSLNSRHTAGFGLDMTICWNGTLKINDATGHTVEIDTLPRSGMNKALQRVAETYGVIKYCGTGVDQPHWSDNGR